MGDSIRSEGRGVSSTKSIPRNLLQLTVVMALLVYGCGEQPAVYPARRMPDGLMQDVAQLQAGQELFKSKCASCHGKLSEGRSDRATFFKPPAPDFKDIHYREIDPAYGEARLGPRGQCVFRRRTGEPAPGQLRRRAC